jgi:hypothetical protein
MIGMLLESRLPGDGLALPSSLPDRLRGTDLSESLDEEFVRMSADSNAMEAANKAIKDMSEVPWFKEGISGKAVGEKKKYSGLFAPALGIGKAVSSKVGGGVLGGVMGGAAGGLAMGGPLGMLLGGAGGGAMAVEDSIKSWLGLSPATAASAGMPTGDIHDRVQRDISGSRSSTSVGGKELAMISSSTDQQCATLVEIRDHLKAMRDLAGGTDTSSGYSSPTADGGDPSSNIQPKSSPEYYKWQFGKHGQIGNKQVINTGK